MISFAKNPALGAHTYILEDVPELPESSGSSTPEGGEVIEVMYAQGCTSIEESRIHGQSGRAEGLDTVSGVRPSPTCNVTRDPRTVPT
jgi:hypothetical protein